jgi:putative ABC transport system permease protein
VAVLGRLFSWSLPGRLERLNSGRNPRRTAITAAALMVGIALVTGVTVVMQSAESSLSAQAADTIKAQVVIGGDQNGPRPPTFDGSVLGAAAALPGVRTVAGLWNDHALVDGKLTYVTATDDLARLSDAYGGAGLPALSATQMAVSTQEAAKHHWAVGSGVRVQLSRGEARGYVIAATYDEKVLPGSYILPAAATKDFGLSRPVFGFVRLTGDDAVSSVLPRIKTPSRPW